MNFIRKVGVTATQHGLQVKQAERARAILGERNPDEIHHGGCIGGDTELHWMATELGIPIVIHPPLDRTKMSAVVVPAPGVTILAPLSYLARNAAIVADTHFVLACPRESHERLRSGTWATVRQAKKQGKPYRIVYPDGSAS